MLTKDLAETTHCAVNSLRRAAAGHRVEFIFVDCCSRDGSHRLFRELSSSFPVKVIITHPEEPFVYSRNCNRGAQAARGRYLVFANNDIEVLDEAFFNRLHRTLSDPRVGAAGTRTDYDCSNPIQQSAGLDRDYVWSQEPVMGFLWAMRSTVFSELGGLDEQFSGYGCDEIDFQYRLLLKNYRIAVVNSLVHHDLHATFGYELEQRLAENVARFDAKHQCSLRGNGRWYRPFHNLVDPVVSVAIACRNHGRDLGRAIDSAMSCRLPSGQRAQIVVVDDGSSDETASVTSEYSRRYPELVNMVRREFSRGPAAAKNAAIERCIAEHVALLDADDEFFEYKLLRSLEELECSGADFVYHDYIAAFPDGTHRSERIGEWSLKRWRRGRSLPPSTWVFRRDAVRFCADFPSGEDPEFLRRNWRRLQTRYLPEALTRYHISGSGLSSRSTCRVVTGQLKGLAIADVGSCSDIVTEIPLTRTEVAEQLHRDDDSRVMVAGRAG